MKTITQDELKELFSYCPNTGLFTRVKVPIKNQTLVGDIATPQKDGYIHIGINNKTYLGHRLAWMYVYGYTPLSIDHINQDRSDNRISNLREVSQSVNTKNQPRRKNNTLFNGVYKNKQRGGKYKAHIRVSGKLIHLGYFNVLKDAINARIHANRLYGFHKNHGL